MTDAPPTGSLEVAGNRAGPERPRHRARRFRRRRAPGLRGHRAPGFRRRAFIAGLGAAAVGSVVVIGGTSLVTANSTSKPRWPCTATYSVTRTCHVSGGNDGQRSAPTGPVRMALPPGVPASSVPASPSLPTHRVAVPSGPIGPLYVDSQGPVADWVAANAGDPRAAVIQARIARKAQARWFAEDNPDAVESQVSAYTSRGAASGTIPILVAYNIVHRDCGGASAGGAGSADDYRAWIRNFAAGLGTRSSIVILEPDALPHLTACLSADQQAQRRALLSYAGQVIKAASPRARIYYDIGNSGWLGVGDAVAQLRQVDATLYGDGIALNTSNYRTNDEEIAYGKQILAGLGTDRLQLVVDTSRNGAGPAADGTWCDPAGRKLGTDPTTRTGDSQVAAFLWVKRPGESDGCSGSAGQFLPDTAYALST